ncbi:sensor histidine kinase [Streptomyces sp. NPDC093546]|uniref:sensor histidine kinase n=1 Tax=Streptomyces sp. NPDC093546 TaxID=3366040 RepID=UPI0037FAA19E
MCLLRPLAQWVTYTRWLHLCVPSLLVAVWMFIDPGRPWVPAVLVPAAGLVPWVRQAEGVQARLLLAPGAAHAEGGAGTGAGITAVASAGWEQRWRTVLWLAARMALAAAAMFATVRLPMLSADLLAAGPPWVYVPLAVLPLVVLLAVVVGLGELVTAVARRLLGPSAAERLAALEERTERLLEGNRLARELHDSIGHALTVAVVQAGAARAAKDPEFTERALAAVEETGRSALEDLERVLKALRDPGQAPARRPALDEADRLLESARAAGADVVAEVSGPLEQVPGPVSREGYRILQEALTNVLRHAGGGPVPVTVRVAVSEGWVDIEVTNPVAGAGPGPGPGPFASVAATAGGSGLRGIRERAALLGGKAFTGPFEDGWRVCASLPVDGLR